MLEKNAFKILGVIADLATEGENLVVEKAELIEKSGVEMSPEELERHLDGLELNDMIAVRYTDANLCCVALRPKGKLVAEKNRREVVANKERKEESDALAEEDDSELSLPAAQNINFKLLAIICGAASFCGGLVAAIVAFLIARFG